MGGRYLSCMQAVGKCSDGLPIGLAQQSTPHQKIGLVLQGQASQLGQSQHLHTPKYTIQSVQTLKFHNQNH